MLRLKREGSTITVPIAVGGEVTKFTMRALSIQERLEFIDSMAADKPAGKEGFVQMVKLLADVIDTIEGIEGKSPYEALMSLEDMADLITVSREIQNYIYPSDDLRKNSSSSPEPPTQESAGIVAQTAKEVLDNASMSQDRIA